MLYKVYVKVYHCIHLNKTYIHKLLLLYCNKCMYLNIYLCSCISVLHLVVNRTESGFSFQNCLLRSRSATETFQQSF